jgi:hypothetical protein
MYLDDRSAVGVVMSQSNVTSTSQPSSLSVSSSSSSESLDLLSVLRGFSMGASLTKVGTFQGSFSPHFDNVTNDFRVSTHSEHGLYDATPEYDADPNEVEKTPSFSSTSSLNIEQEKIKTFKQHRFASTDMVLQTILSLSIEHIHSLQLHQGPLKMTDFMNMYWSLSHKLHLWTIKPIQPDNAIVASYTKLLSLYSDPSAFFKSFK